MGSVEHVDETVARARQAAGQGQARAAYELLRDRDDELDVDGLALLAELAYVAGDVAATFEAWERVHDDALSAGDRVGAASAAAQVAMHLLLDTGLLAPVRIWLKRAHRLLAGEEATPVEAVLAVAEGYERLLAGDAAAALTCARRAIEVGTAHEVAAPVALARVMEARGVLFSEDVGVGLELLDDSAALALSEEVDPLSVGLVYCELVCAWQGLAEYERAATLTDDMERWCRRHPDLGSVHGRCRVHRAELLRVHGDLAAAEEEASAACEELQPYLRREYGWPLTELGTIRLRRGELAGARAAFLEAHRTGWDPQPGLALLHLQRGETDTAVTMIEQALERPLGVPSKELPPDTALQRAPLLSAHVEAALAAGHLDAARRTAHELSDVAETYTSPALQAHAALATGRVALAEGDTAAARHAHQHALAVYSELSMPYEAARARQGLAQTHRAEGTDRLADLEADAAENILRQLGAVTPETPPDEATPVPAVQRSPAPDAPTSMARLVAEADHVALSFNGDTVRLRNLKGLRYLAQLLAEPGREFHALDLVTAEHGHLETPAPLEATQLTATDPGLEPALDERAKAAYRRRLRELEEDVEEARAMGADERVARAKVEREFLVAELARAVGLAGRDRPEGSAGERARTSVTRAIRYALRRVREQHPELGAHLDHAVRTGTYLSYDPDPQSPVRWELGDR